MTVVYSVSHAEGVLYVPTKREAMSIYRSCSKDEPDATFASVTRITVTDRLPRRELFCALLNSKAFAERQEDVAP